MALDIILKEYITKEKTLANYIKIGDPTLSVFGNKYFISPEKHKEFEKAYRKHVFGGTYMGFFGYIYIYMFFDSIAVECVLVCR